VSRQLCAGVMGVSCAPAGALLVLCLVTTGCASRSAASPVATFLRPKVGAWEGVERSGDGGGVGWNVV